MAQRSFLDLKVGPRSEFHTNCMNIISIYGIIFFLKGIILNGLSNILEIDEVSVEIIFVILITRTEIIFFTLR